MKPTWIKEIEERDESIQEIVGRGLGIESTYAQDDRHTLLKAYNKARQLLEAYEQWEADLVQADECWRGDYPAMNKSLYDRWMELQEKRNEALNYNPTEVS